MSTNMNEVLLNIIVELKGAWRFRSFALYAAWAFCIIGWITVYALPNVYESKAKVDIDTTSVLKPYLNKMAIDSDVTGPVDIVTKAMLGRPQLEKVARETGLYFAVPGSEITDELIIGIRKNIGILNNPEVDPNLYEISFRDKDPEMAQEVVETLISILTRDWLRADREETEREYEVIGQQLSQLEAESRAAEQALADFKQKYASLMTLDHDDHVAHLQNEITALDSVRSELKRADKRRLAIRDRLSGQSLLAGSSNEPQSELDELIAESRERLEKLQLRFDDQYPDVILLKANLEELRRKKKNEVEALMRSDGSGALSEDPVTRDIQVELISLNTLITRLKEEKEASQLKVDELKDRLGAIPGVELELSRLTQNFSAKHTQYEKLHQRLEKEKLSNETISRGGVGFHVIDAPLIPDKPVNPDRSFRLAIVFLLGLVAAAGTALLSNYFMPVVKGARSLRGMTRFPVLASVTVMNTAIHKKNRQEVVLAFAVAIAALCILFSIVLLFQEAGVLMLQALI